MNQSFARVSLAAASFSLLIALPRAVPPAGAAGISECARRIDKITASFAKRRAQHITHCKDAGDCSSAALARRLNKVRSRAVEKLLTECSGVSAADLGLGSMCPDASRRCTQVLDSSGAIAECVVCMIAETIDPLVRRLRGYRSDDAESCGGCSATQCESNLFCETPPGHCDGSTAAGTCIEPPSACPEVLEPVCGCDGSTYENDCFRQQARVGLFHPGPCVRFCDGAAGDICPGGTVCDALPGHCDETLERGICVPVPDECRDDEEPVCGCDGVTYAGNCHRLAAGVRLRHFGRCHLECAYDGSVQSDCEPGTFCEQMPGVCGEPASHGVCVETPQACPDVYHPVCGCDHATYGNDCERLAAEVGKLHDGRCESLCGGIAGIACEPTEVCGLPPGLCEATDLAGHCVPRPEACPELLEPVCGCDGVTYANDCVRLQADAQVAHFGPCLEHCVPGADTCPPEHACIQLPGHCGEPVPPAACVPIPDVCPLVSWPVCGCDGVTYDTPCEPVTLGVQIAHPGPCE